MKTLYAWGVIIALGAGTLLGQGTPPVPSFDVASIKPSPPFSLDKMLSGQIHIGSIKGSEADFQFVSLADLLAYAYRVKPYQISGPGWIRDGRWDIKTKLPEGESPASVPEMVLSLLIERFKLEAHHETRENSAYELVVDKGGPKFKESLPDDDPAVTKAGDETAGNSSNFSLGGFPLGTGNMTFNNDGKGLITGGPNGTTRVTRNPNGTVHMEMSKMPMPSLAAMLTPFVERPVTDRTGLPGTYRIALDLPFAEMLKVIQNLAGNGAFQPRFPGFPGGGFPGGFPGSGGAPGTGGGPGSDAASDPTTSMFQVVQQLGLKLESRKAPVDTIVIDHLEKTPTEN